MARKFSAFTNNPSRVPLDTLVGLDISAAAAAQNTYWSLNTLFSEITGNITDGALRFGGFAAPAVSAAGKAALYFDSTSNTLKLSNNAGAYADVRSGTVTVPQGGTGLTTLTAYALMAAGTTATGNMQQVSGVGTSGQVLTSNGAGALPTWQAAAGTIGGSIANTQVAVGSGANTIAGSSALTFASGGLSITGTTNPGIAITGTAATESGVTVFQSVSGTAADAFLHFQSPSTDMLFRLTTAGFTPTGLVKANQIDLLGATGTVEMLFRLADASTRFVFGVNDVEAASINATASLGLVLGAASTLTGRMRMYNSAGTTYTQLSAGNAAASLNYILPATSPTAGQVLSASAPSGSDVTLSWTSAGGGSSLTATQVGFGSGANALTGSADLIYLDATGVFDLTKTLNSSVRYTVANLSNGTAAQARFGITNDAGNGAALISYSSGFTTSGLRVANSSVLDLDGPVSLILGQAAGVISLGLGVTEYARLNTTRLSLLSVGLGATPSAADVLLERDASNVLAQRNGANAQTFRIYNTYTDDSNYERANLGWSSNEFGISTIGAGTGAANRNIVIQTGGGQAIRYVAGSAGNVFTGNIIYSADNTYDFGSSGAARPRNVYIAGSLNASFGLFKAASGAAATSRVLTVESSTVDLFGVTAGGSLVQTNLGTAPTVSVANACLTYVADVAAANAELFCRDENGEITRLTGVTRVLDQDFPATTTTLANITGAGIYGSLTFNVEASKPYQFRAVLFVDADATGGWKVTMAGTATTTAVRWHVLGFGVTAGLINNTQWSALGSGSAATGNGVTTYKIEIDGYLLVNAAGTLTVQFAQNSASATSYVKQGSFFTILQGN